jgi:hypothetical protein
MGYRVGLDDVEKKNIFYLCREFNPGRPVRSLTLYQLSYPLSQQTVRKLIKLQSNRVEFQYFNVIKTTIGD